MSLSIVHIAKEPNREQEVKDLWFKTLLPKFQARDRQEAITKFKLPESYFDESDQKLKPDNDERLSH